MLLNLTRNYIAVKVITNNTTTGGVYVPTSQSTLYEKGEIINMSDEVACQSEYAIGDQLIFRPGGMKFTDVDSEEVRIIESFDVIGWYKKEELDNVEK